MPTYTVKAEVLSSTTKSQPIVVKATMVPPRTTKSKQSTSNKRLPSRANKRSRKQQPPKKHHPDLLSCPAAMASIALFFIISALLLLSQLNCFNTHFGLPKLVTDTRVHHSSENVSSVDLMGNTEVTLDSASIARLQAHAKSGGGLLEIKMDHEMILNILNSGGQPIQLSDEQIQKAISSQIPQLEPAQRRDMPIPTNTAWY
jgi:hypothetical protein